MHTAEDVLKAMMAGANVAMLTSELLAHGIDRAARHPGGLQAWMIEHEYESIAQMRGQHEPARRGRAGRLRARQLHEGAEFV